MAHAAVRDARRISTRFSRKGALIAETYLAFRTWDRTASIRVNIERIRQENPIGARNSAWLREITTTLSSRFRDQEMLDPLVVLAQRGFPVDKWRACLLWHIGQQDALFYTFVCEWLYGAYRAGVVQIRTEDLVPFVVEQTRGRLRRGASLSPYSQTRTAQDLLRMAAGFGLLKGRAVREFTGYHLPDDCFLYVLHALAEQHSSPQRMIEAPEWRLFLMSPADIENELLRLHQFRRVDYQAAGSLIELALPYPSLLQYAESLVA